MIPNPFDQCNMSRLCRELATDLIEKFINFPLKATYLKVIAIFHYANVIVRQAAPRPQQSTNVVLTRSWVLNDTCFVKRHFG